ncbi:MAG: hypothetical protein ABSF08_11200 [Candidatus Cybelea sp.]|jgi:hypothetical protein
MLALLALSTAIPVVVRSMPPEQVTSLPGPDGWALLGIVAALVAAFASVRAVQIANKSYGLAKDELKVVTSEFEELTRRPDIRVEARIAYEKVHRPSREGGLIFLDGFAVIVEVMNTGRRLARSVIAEMLIPESLKPETNHMSVAVFRVAKMRVDSETLLVYTIDLPDLHPNGAQVARRFPPLAFQHDVPECKLLLRVYDENFAYPEKEPQWLTYRSPVIGVEAQLE